MSDVRESFGLSVPLLVAHIRGRNEVWNLFQATSSSLPISADVLNGML